MDRSEVDRVEVERAGVERVGVERVGVEQVLVVFEPALGVDAEAMAAAWAEDPEAKAYLNGVPATRREPGSTYRLDVLNIVVLPLAVNIASTVLIEIAVRLVRGLRGRDSAGVEQRTPGGDLIILVTERPGEGPEDR